MLWLLFGRPPDKDYTIHRMLIGTHTSDNDNNYLQIATVNLPKSNQELNIEKYDEERGGPFFPLSLSFRDHT